ncbi:MAG: cell division protein ZapA [Lachnospiraceae bacterium]|nr:cell division protein ZapA [Lachnospiraceae bacterium]
MAAKTDAEVLIGGKVYTLCGYESEEYLQKVASYINNKLAEYNAMEGFRRSSIDMQNVLMQINLADDYFKVKKQIATMEEEMEAKDKEVYDLKHELVTNQIKMENLDKSLKSAKEELAVKDKKIVQLETQLKHK